MMSSQCLWMMTMLKALKTFLETIFEYGLERHHIEEMKEWIEEQHK